MNKSKIYIAGPMTGIPQFNFPMFDTYRDVYLGLDYEVFNPADHDRKLLGKEANWMPSVQDQVDNWKAWHQNATKDGLQSSLPTLRDMLGADLAWIAANATHIAMLPNWEKSSGANAEWSLAKALGLTIHYYPLPNEIVSVMWKEKRGKI